MPRSLISALVLALLVSGCASGVPTEDATDADPAADVGNRDDPKDSPLMDIGTPDPNPEPDATPDPNPGPSPVPDVPDPPIDMGEDIPDPVCDDLWYPDTDRDGHGDPDGEPVTACAPPPEYAGSTDDCDDTDPLIKPGAEDLCDGVDNDCDGRDNCDYPCPSAERDGVTYLFCSGAGNFDQARTLCGNEGFHLVKVDDDAENTFLLQQAQANGLNETWIGLNDIVGTGGVFVWHDGSQPGYTNWNTDQPNNRNDQDCAEMHTQMDPGKWNDEECTTAQDAICEIDP